MNPDSAYKLGASVYGNVTVWIDADDTKRPDRPGPALVRHETQIGEHLLHLPHLQLESSCACGAGGGESFFNHQGAAGGAASLPGPSAVLVKQLKTGSCHAELVELPAPGEPGLAFV